MGQAKYHMSEWRQKKGKKRQKSKLRQANLYFIYYYSFLFICFQHDSEEKKGFSSVLLFKFSKEVQIFKDYPQDLGAILQSLHSPKALPLGVSFLSLK